MTGWFQSWFAWYQGGIWTNIAASFIWSALVWFPTLLHLHRKNDRQHQALIEQGKKHHAALKRHLGIEETDENGA